MERLHAAIECRLHQRATTGESIFSAQTKVTTQPMAVHPRKRFKTRIETASRLLRAKAMMAGKKYSTKPKPKMGRKNAIRSMPHSPAKCKPDSLLNTIYRGVGFRASGTHLLARGSFNQKILS